MTTALRLVTLLLALGARVAAAAPLPAGAPQPAGASAAASDEAPARVLRVGVENLDYLPIGAVEGGRWTGAGRDILDAFAEDEGLSLEYVPLAVARLHATFLDGGVDFKFPDNPKWKADLKRGRAIVYSRPVIAYVDGTLTTPRRAGQGADAIRVVGSAAGFTPWDWLDEIETGRVQLKENADLASLVRQAVVGRVDAVYASVAVVNHQLDDVLRQPGALVLDTSLPHARDHYSLSTIAHPEIVEAFDAWLAAHAQDVAAIKELHGAEKGVPR
jgi:polar amino acid transport system substrate-binding protein